MAQQIIIEGASAAIPISSFNGSGVAVPLNIGANVFTDGDGVNRAHAIAQVAKVLSSTETQAALAPATLSTLLYLDTANGFTLMVSSSAACNVTVYVTRAGGGAAYQLCSATGAPIVVAFTAGQALAIPIATGAYSVGIQVSATSTVTIEVCGAVGI